MTTQDEDIDAIESLIYTAMRIKRDITHNGPDDIEPVLAYWSRDIHSSTMLIRMIPTEPVPDDFRLSEILPTVLAQVRTDFGPPRMVALISEGYSLKEPLPDEMEHRRPSELFARGDPRATECIMVCGFRMGGPVDGEHNGELGWMFLTLPFHYADGGVQFDEPVCDADGAGGELFEALHSVFAIDTN